MQITGIDAIPVEIPVKPLGDGFGVAPYVSGTRLENLPRSLSYEEALDQANGTESSSKLLVKLETDTDINGWGEIIVPSVSVGMAMFEDVIFPQIDGLSIWEIESFVERFELFPSSYYRDITPFLGATEIAMWDAYGKYLDKPVHELIGGKRMDTVRAAFCLGLMSPEDSRKYARKALENGFDVLKTKASRYWRQDVDRIIAMHDEVNGKLEFRLDPNQLWSFNDALRVGAMLEDEGIYLQYLEQPIRIDNFGTYSQLRSRLKQPIAVNEDSYFPRNLFHLGRESAIDSAVIDIIPSGGLLGFKRRAAVASDMGISIAHHSNFDTDIKIAAKLHAMSSTTGCDLAIDTVHYSYQDHLLENPLEMENGRLKVPDEPGLAGYIDEEKVEKYQTDGASDRFNI